MYLFYHLTNIENVDEKHLDYTPPTWYMDAPKKPGHFRAKPNFSSKLTHSRYRRGIWQKVPTSQKVISKQANSCYVTLFYTLPKKNNTSPKIGFSDWNLMVYILLFLCTQGCPGIYK